MKIINLVEDTQGKNEKVKSEHGLCFYVETDSHKILVDTGMSDLAVENALALHIDLSEVDTIIITHGHNDHGGGLKYALKASPDAKVYIQKNAFSKRISLNHEEPRDISLDSKLKKNKQVVLVEGDYTIDEELALLQCNSSDFPVPSGNAKLKIEEDGAYRDDDFTDEMYLRVKAEEKEILFVGCSHRGILNIMDSYRKKYGHDPDLVIGGFHMKHSGEYTDKEIAHMQDTAKVLSHYQSRYETCHCTGEGPYEVMKMILKDDIGYIHAGEAVNLNRETKKAKGANTYMKMHRFFAWATVFSFALTMLTGYKRK